MMLAEYIFQTPWILQGMNAWHGVAFFACDIPQEFNFSKNLHNWLTKNLSKMDPGTRCRPTLGDARIMAPAEQRKASHFLHIPNIH